MKALLVGAGKMGRAIEEELNTRGHQVAASLRRGSGWENVNAVTADVAFEFTVPDAAEANCARLLALGIPTVSGTTGWNAERAAERAREVGVPFLHAANFSVGVAALRAGVEAVSRLLAALPEFQPGIVERHHSAKKDAPSGTAKLLARALGAGSAARDVPIVSLRQGGQPGEHTVIFEGPGESVELVHRARSRAIFAAGAVRAAEWLLASGSRGPATFDDFLAGLVPGGAA